MPPDTARTLAFQEIVERFQRRIIAIAYRILGDLEEAKDMAQETFVRYWRGGTASTEEKAIFGYLARTATNLCIDQLRRRRRYRLFLSRWRAPEMEPASPDDPERETAGRELAQLVLDTAERLKPRQKAVFVLRDIEGYSVRETSEFLGCSENNVLVTLHQARKNLRKWLEPILR